MSSYTVTISPEEGGGAETTIRVDVENWVARITELVVRPSAGRDGSGEIGGIDLDLLMRVVQPAITAIEGGRNPSPAPASPRRSRAADAGQRTAGRPGDDATATAEAPARASASLRPRAYRRIPPDLREAFARLGSVTEVAAHYDVPRHTAQGWINRLRRELQASE